jgi:hypothetical protein
VIAFRMAVPSDDEINDPVALPIDGVLDLHTFPPREVKNVVLAYLEACQQKGILEVRAFTAKALVTCNAPFTRCSRHTRRSLPIVQRARFTVAAARQL